MKVDWVKHIPTILKGAGAVKGWWDRRKAKKKCVICEGNQVAFNPKSVEMITMHEGCLEALLLAMDELSGEPKQEEAQG